MESLELIASCVAHDINNLFSGIVTYPELLLMRKGLDEKTCKALKLIQESGERAAALIGDLTTIARDNALNRESICLNSMVQEYLISPEYRKLQLSQAGITLRTTLEADLFNIDVSRLHIRRSIMHLVSYAAHAIGSNGQITISTARRSLDQPLKSYADVKPGEYAVLSVSDTGGIQEQDIDRIFEPFYTRKMFGRNGTGLELAVVWHTVADHNGYVLVNGSPAAACIEMYFPKGRMLSEGLAGE
jgi:signal transduction histidine kinase